MMRRTVSLPTPLHALVAVPLLMTAWLSAAPAMAEEEPDLVISIVYGVAPNDLLNVRAAASAVARIETRLVNGDSVTNLGCNDVNGYKWCRIEGAGKTKFTGWTPARYLIPLNPAPYVERAAEAKPAEAPQVAATGAGDETDGPQTAPQVTANNSDADAATRARLSAPPPDLTARLGGVDPAPPAESTLKSAADIGRAAMQDAYGLAFAAQENPTAGEIRQAPAAAAAEASLPAPAAEAPAAATAPTEEAVADPAIGPDPVDDSTAPVASGIPIPTPRPGRTVEASAVDPQVVARVEPPQPLARAPDATGEIPCARYFGQPMTRCEVSVLRNGSGKADIIVTWPDGGTRVISFYAGQPAGSNSRSDFRFTREGSLNMIRVGAAERFEVTDSLALGD
ncbi:SH3 domain-containing protein [Mesorhizobium sp. ES1-1]|uniref:SH3 domain-containing protein n=1 Tax=Mesorhizobium sp. ES1-1 TaxID=2876629 RepID=UPI001CCF5923|nr:SH3 domain-containing protein [Mesorhizobium sp. ES1-1]MBZ9676103.1 SH3 domain-containing protein [Mesorhizobium sp. ES1-1]